LPATGQIVARQKSTGVTRMVEKQQEPDREFSTEDGHNAHPVEPAEGAREPGEDADAPRPPHPDEPAEGER
jgi:hypothetical protein